MASDLIMRLDHWLDSHRPDYYAELQPAVPSRTLDAFESRFALRLPSTYRTLLEWRNGQSVTCHSALQFNRMFLSLERVGESKSVLDDMIGSDFEDPMWWRAGWVPFLDNGGGDHLCLDITAEDGGVPGQVVAFWHDSEDRYLEYPSIDRWLDVFVESLEAGIWRDVHGDLHPQDDARWNSFLRARNAGYPIRRKAGGAA